MSEKRIVFMGTPEFAAHSLERLLENGFNIVGVVTVADKPAGRGQQVQESAVKKVALKHNLPLLQPVNLKDENFLSALRSWEADLFVVVAFRMLPEVVWSMPPLGSINLHASLLPQFRGAAPINHAIMAGERETGVTTFFIEKEIDTGKILLAERTSIDENETAGTLHDRLMHLGADLLCRTLEGVFAGTLYARPQSDFDTANLKHAPKIFKAHCEINWNQNAQKVHDFIRGLSPYPTAWTRFALPEIKSVKIFLSRKTNRRMSETVGDLIVEKEGMFVQCADYAIEIVDLQLEGKRRVSAQEFVRGLRSPIALAEFCK
jgi:methionyl-tRNA formyltransferase